MTPNSAVIAPLVYGDSFDWLGRSLRRVLVEDPVQILMNLLRAWEAVERLSDCIGHHVMHDILNHDAPILPEAACVVVLEPA